MGNTRSSHFEQKLDDVWLSNTKTNEVEQNGPSYSGDSVEVNDKKLSEDSVRKLDEFKIELARKREKRKEIINQKTKEMDELREEIQRLREENSALRRVQHQQQDNSDHLYRISRLEEENETLKMLVSEKGRLLLESEKIIDKNRELRVESAEMQKELQRLNSEMLNFEKERQDYKAHVVALKDVLAVSKNMLQIRETELTELKAKIEEIEKSLAEKEVQLLSRNLRSEYERQMANIRDLRTLYEERQRAGIREKEELVQQLNDAKKDLEDQQNKNRELQERITELEEDNSKKYDEIKQLESNVGIVKAESRQYQAELTVINQLFSEILLGFNTSQDIDLDKLQKHLEQHHDLLQDIVINEVPSESYALPKVLLDLVNQVEAGKVEQADEKVQMGGLETIEEESESATSTLHSQMNSAEEIVENLPKVWRILIELLSHHVAPVNELSGNSETDNPCYKTVETAKGPSVVLSVSQTFIRLKDLILEKKSLEKETSHLKQLNGHLENRLQDQEKRLERVQSELSKTWYLVGKLQKQHQMLHTQEKILRYELAQKRKLLTQLKEELEYSREKWAQAREKNTNTEEQWKQLRTEFASRKTTLNDDSNNSTESGYSDDKECSSSEDEPSYEDEVDVPKNTRRNSNVSTHTLTMVNVEETTNDASASENLGISSEELTQANTLISTSINEECSNGTCSKVCDIPKKLQNSKESFSTNRQGDCSNSVCGSTEENLGITSEGLIQAKTITSLKEDCTSDTCSKVCDIPTKIQNSKGSISTNCQGECSNSIEKTFEPLGDTTEEVVVKTWEKVSDIVQKEILRLTDQEQKTDSNLDMFLVDDRLSGTSQETEKTDLINVPSTSKGSSRTLEEVLAARNERFKRLEEQAQQLRTKVVNTNRRSNEISNKLDSLHETYGQSVDSTSGGEVVTDNNQENSTETETESLEPATDDVIGNVDSTGDIRGT